MDPEKIAKIVAEYASGMSLTEVASANSTPVSTVRHNVKKYGELRGRAEAVRMAASAGKLGAGMRGRKRSFTPAHRKAISDARVRWADGGNAVGVSIKPNGYVEFTRGPNKGRSVHVVAMEARIGRRLKRGECVHHIDGNKTNNSDDNLALMTVAGHARLHRFEDKISGKARKVGKDGRFC